MARDMSRKREEAVDEYILFTKISIYEWKKLFKNFFKEQLLKQEEDQLKNENTYYSEWQITTNMNNTTLPKLKKSKGNRTGEFPE